IDYLAKKYLLKEEKEAIQEYSKVSGIEKNKNKIFLFCQKLVETKTADGTNIIRSDCKYENEFKKIKIVRIDVKIDDQIDNTARCLYIDVITGLQNNKVTNNAAKLAEVEEIMGLASHIKKKDNFNLTTKVEVLNKKDAELDLEDLIDDYLEIVKERKEASKNPQKSVALRRIETRYFYMVKNLQRLELLTVPNHTKEIEAKVGYEDQIEANKNKNNISKIESKDKIEIDSDVLEIVKEKTGHLVGMIKPGFKNSIEDKKKASMEYQELIEVDNCGQMKLDQKEKVKDKKDLKDLIIAQSYDQNSTKEKRIAFDFNQYPIEDKYSKVKVLEDNQQHGISICLIGIKLKVENNSVRIEYQIK
ncbi:7582_t:CDS:2, partial [Gigaspora margarita]